MKGLTSKQHLFMRVILVVTLANAAIYYSIFRNLQALTVTWQFAEVAVLATAVTLFALTVNLEFWWRYQRKWQPENPKFEKLIGLFNLEA